MANIFDRISIPIADGSSSFGASSTICVCMISLTCSVFSTSEPEICDGVGLSQGDSESVSLGGYISTALNSAAELQTLLMAGTSCLQLQSVGFYQGCFRGLCFVSKVEQPSEILVKTEGLRNRLKELIMKCRHQECDCLP